MTAAPAIWTEALTKSFGDVTALRGVDLAVEPGTVLGLLGPNGAGKTTTVRILATLLQPDGGRASVAGYDVVRDAAKLRAAIGLAGQYAAVDETLTGRENIELVGRLYHLSKAEARRRADDLLERFGLAEAGTRQVKTYSGGMRRRLDLAASLVGGARILFLDEPTTGLDPRGRLGLWEVIETLVGEGATLLLTTQYLDEADRLSNRIAVIDDGLVIAEGTSDELKTKVGGDLVELHLADPSQVGAALDALSGLALGSEQVQGEPGRLTLPAGQDGARVLTDAIRRLDAGGIPLSDVALRRPTLDDVFLALTGHGAQEVAKPSPDGHGGRRRRAASSVGPQEAPAR